MSQNIMNKVIVITGASSGIGAETAKYLASLGGKVVLGARRNNLLQSIVAEIKDNGGEADSLVTDVTQKSDVDALVDHAINSFGQLDVIINNAGIMSLAPLDKLQVNEWDRMIDVNIKGLLYGVAAALPIFRRQNYGHFINIASVAGIKVLAGGAVYCGTKHAVRAISEGIRMESGNKIRSTCINPGAIDTELKHGTSDAETADFVNQLYDNLAIPANSIAHAIAYAIEQPDDVDINEIVVRPTAQEL